MATDSPATARILLPGLDIRHDMAAADDMVEVIDTLDTHMNTQLMNTLATLNTSNSKKEKWYRRHWSSRRWPLVP